MTHSTMGQSSPATAAEGSGWYKFKKDPNWPEDRSAYADEGSAARKMAAGSGGAVQAKARQERLAEFAAVLAELGEPDPEEAPNPAVIEAGRRIGVGGKTAKSYRTELKQQQVCDGEVQDA